MRRISMLAAWRTSQRLQLSAQIAASALDALNLVIQTRQAAFAPSVSFVPPPATSARAEISAGPRQDYISESLWKMFADHSSERLVSGVTDTPGYGLPSSVIGH